MPRFTRVGFKKIPIPPEIYSEILEEYEVLKSKPEAEEVISGCQWTINNCEEIVSDEILGMSSLKKSIPNSYLMQLRYLHHNHDHDH